MTTSFMPTGKRPKGSTQGLILMHVKNNLTIDAIVEKLGVERKHVVKTIEAMQANGQLDRNTVYT